MPKNVTIDELAAMVAKGFESIGNDIKELRNDLADFKKEMYMFRDKTNDHFTELKRSDSKQNDDIKNLEYRVKQLENSKI